MFICVYIISTIHNPYYAIIMMTYTCIYIIIIIQKAHCVIIIMKPSAEAQAWTKHSQYPGRD